MALDGGAMADRVDRTWDDAIVPALCDYIRIPNVSPAYDADGSPPPSPPSSTPTPPGPERRTADPSGTTGL